MRSQDEERGDWRPPSEVRSSVVSSLSPSADWISTHLKDRRGRVTLSRRRFPVWRGRRAEPSRRGRCAARAGKPRQAAAVPARSGGVRPGQPPARQQPAQPARRAAAKASPGRLKTAIGIMRGDAPASRASDGSWRDCRPPSARRARRPACARQQAARASRRCRWLPSVASTPVTLMRGSRTSGRAARDAAREIVGRRHSASMGCAGETSHQT